MLCTHNGHRLGLEVKLTRSPKVTAAMRKAQDTLSLEHLYVVCHGTGDDKPWPLAQGIIALPLNAFASVDLR